MKTGNLSQATARQGLDGARPDRGAGLERKQAGTLIPRALLFGNPSRFGAQLNPDGTQLAWVAPDDGVLNIWLAPVGDLDAARPITDDRDRGIRFYEWAYNGTHLIYIQDDGGDEGWHVHAVALGTGEDHDITPIKGVTAQTHSLSWDHPNHVIVGLNDREPEWHDLYRIDLRTGERELVYQNDRGFGEFVLDRSFNLKLGTITDEAEGGQIVHRYVDGEWEEFLRVPYEDELTTRLLGFEQGGDVFYMLDSLGRDKAILARCDLTSSKRTLLGSHPKVDIGYVLTNSVTGVAEAFGTQYGNFEWQALDGTVGADLDFLQVALDGEIHVTSRTRDDTRWLVTVSAPDRPTTCYHYDRAGRRLKRLFCTRPELEAERLAPMQVVSIATRDRLEMVSYLTLPKNPALAGKTRPARPLPMVLMVHGGPWARDYYGYDARHQWLADRGYAVLSVNFRGSTGFGKAFVKAGDLQWGQRMHDDLLDAVQWAIDEGITEHKRVAIMGGSYGGYAVLAGLAFTPEAFACGVDIVGPSNLETLLATVPPYWKSHFESLARRVGDPRTEGGRELLKERSPVHQAGRISKPLLIGQGANDPRVKQAESEQIVEAMTRNGLPVTYVLYPDEGHGFMRPENSLSFNAIVEAFLGECLGGRIEPVGTDFEGSSLEIRMGKEHVSAIP
jgi:dipeptidyl aminopeptidase/acylaminoacyl peptidase